MARKKANKLQACLLIYDIPDDSEAQNPSRQLRRVAVRVNLSCWVILERLIPYALLAEMESLGCEWHVVRFDTDETDKLVKMTARALRRDVARAERMVALAQEEARTALGDVRRNPVERAAELRVARARLRRAEIVLEDLARAAEGFGVELDVAGPLAAIGAIRDGVGRRVKAYAALADKARAQGHTAWAARVAAQDRIPVGVLLDVVEESGGDVSEEREAFDGVEHDGGND